jgi:hypothetical protein
MVSAACTFDASKLRRPTSGSQDAAIEYPAKQDMAAVEKAGPSRPSDAVANVTDERDVLGTEVSEVEASFDGSLEADAAADDGAPADLPVVADDGPASGTGGVGGGGDGGAGGTSTGGAGGAGGTSTGGGGGGGSSDGGGEATDGPSLGDVLFVVDGPDDDVVAGDGVDDLPANLAPDAADGPGAVDVSAEVGSGIDPDLVLWYRFDESSGTTAFDSAIWGGVARNATLTTIGLGATAGFSTTRQVGAHALVLTPPPGPLGSSSGGYVAMPAFNTLAPDAVTIAVWVNLAANTSTQNWERIWDFADSATGPKWLNLTARSSTSPYGPLFAMSATGHTTAVQERLVAPAALTANVWHHIAIVLPSGTPFTGVMYIDGVAVATNDAMTVHLADIGATTNNWFGRSEFTSDPYFNGSLDDFRVYRRALSQQEITALIALH